MCAVRVWGAAARPAFNPTLNPAAICLPLPPLLPRACSTGDGAAGEGSEATASAAASGSVPPTSEQLGGDEEDFVRGRRGSVIRYFRLDGKTKGWQRQAMMDSFNSINCKVRRAGFSVCVCVCVRVGVGGGGWGGMLAWQAPRPAGRRAGWPCCQERPRPVSHFPLAPSAPP